MHKSDVRLLLLVASFTLLASGVYFIAGGFLSPEKEIPASNVRLPEKNPEPASAPLRIIIPSIQADARVLPMGLTESGNMEAPKEPLDTGWFALGSAPGQSGSAVIAGHRGWKIGPAVFDNLHKLKKGDEVIIVTLDNQNLTFVVKELKIYEATDIVPEVWSRNNGRYLNLITCSGKWNSLRGTSEKRLVVFTELKM